MLSVAVVGVRAITAEKGTCVIGPNRGSSAESLGQGVETQAGSVCDAATEGCGACLEQCAPFKKIKDLYGCSLCAGDGWCNPGCAAGEDPDCIVEVVPDQVNDAQISAWYGCGIPPMGLGSLFQSFTPSASPLVAVDLSLRLLVTGYNTTINIRSGDPNGTVLGTATTFVQGPQLTMVNFELQPIDVIPGETYVIEWISLEEGGSVLTWSGARDDTYDDGIAFGCWGTAWLPDNDFIFITYTIT